MKVWDFFVMQCKIRKQMSDIYFLRHGEILDDGNLSNTGFRQVIHSAITIQDLTAHEPIQTIYSSPTLRTLQTSRVASGILNTVTDLIELTDLQEIGVPEGLKQAKRHHESNQLLIAELTENADNIDYRHSAEMETFRELRLRASKVVNLLNRCRHPTLLVSHGQTIKAILMCLMYPERFVSYAQFEPWRVSIDIAEAGIIHYQTGMYESIPTDIIQRKNLFDMSL